MTDSEFLTWIRDRIVHVYGEGAGVDFVLRLGEIIHDTKVREARRSYHLDALMREDIIDGNGRF